MIGLLLPTLVHFQQTLEAHCVRLSRSGENTYSKEIHSRIFVTRSIMPMGMTSISHQMLNCNRTCRLNYLSCKNITLRTFFSHQQIPFESHPNVNPCYFKSSLISHLPNMSCDVGVKSENPMQMHPLGYRRKVVMQYGPLFTPDPLFM